MGDNNSFYNEIMRTGVASLCKSMGFHALQGSTIDIVSDLWQRQLIQLAKQSSRYAVHYGRTQSNFDDFGLAIRDLGMSARQLVEYVQNFEPTALPFKISIPVPFPKESHLNFLRPGSEEVLTRPVHVHEYMPPWNPPITTEEPAVEKIKSTPETTPTRRTSNPSDNENDPSVANKPKRVDYSEKANGLPDKTKTPSKGNDNGVASDDTTNKSISESPNTSSVEASAETSMAVSTTPISTSKSNKRWESPNESPALKRVKMMIEEEGHTLREIKSVMMTTSGFLSSSVEGRLPDARPPPNCDFFDPAPVEKKKKIPTMKRIVEGIKKIDKEKEIQPEPDKEDEFEENLFSNPDKIQKPAKVVKEQEEVDQKKVIPLKEREKKEKSKSPKINRKLSKSFEKIAKESLRKKEERKRLKRMKKLEEQDVKDEVDDQEFDQVSSNEEFCDFNQLSGEEDGYKSPDEMSAKKVKKIKEEKVVEKVTRGKRKRISSAIAQVNELPDTTNSFFGERGFTIEEVEDVSVSEEPSPKKRRTRPKKSPAAEGFESLSVPVIPLNQTAVKSQEKLRTPTKRASKRSSDYQNEMNMLIPEISISVKSKPPPPPPDFNMMLGRIPMQPGLIPTSFAPPPALRQQQSQFGITPSISIIPSTPEVSLTPLTPQELAAGTSTNSMGLPPNISSSITITRINMNEPQQKPAPPTSNISLNSSMSISITRESTKATSSSSSVPFQHDSNSGITITPIVMNQQEIPESNHPESVKVEKKSEEDTRTKEERRRDREKRKELKKEKKKEKKREKEKERHGGEGVSDKKEKKDKDKKKLKDASISSSTSMERMEGTVPKITLKIHSNTSTPVHSPLPPGGYLDRHETPPPTRKITIKPIEESIKRKTPSPELARFSPLVTRPSKPSKSATIKTPTVVTKPVQPNEVVCFPPPGGTSSSGSLKKGKKSGKSKQSKSGSQAGLTTETVGFYIDEGGNKVWICPACGRQDDGSPMIGCDTCDDWYHFTCVGIHDTPDESEQWYCERCKLKSSSKKKGKV